MVTLAELIECDGLWNPYDFAHPVNDDALFAGRGAEIADVRYYLRQAAKAPRPVNLVLTGARSSGKTSLLNKIGIEAVARGLAVARVDLNESDANPLAFFYKVYDAIILSAVTAGAFNGISGQTYSDYRKVMDAGSGEVRMELLFPTHYASAVKGTGVLSEPTLRADLGRISSELGKPMVILFDECDVLAKSRIELEMIRNIFMNVPGYMLVFAGTPNLFPVMEDVFSPIVRQFKKVPVSRFKDFESTIECVEKPLHSLGLSQAEVEKVVPRNVQAEVHRLSGGRPYEIQLLCHFMFRRLEARRARTMSINIDLLDDVRDELENQESGAGRRSVAELRKLTQAQLRDLARLTEFRGRIDELYAYAVVYRGYAGTKDELEGALGTFLESGLLQRDDEGVVSFAGDQFDEV